VQLIDASELYRKLRKNLGAKNCEFAPEHIEKITHLYLDLVDQPTLPPNEDGKQPPRPISKVFRNRDFGYYKVTIERPLRLSAQFTPERVATLRFVPALAEVMEWAYGKWGDDIYTTLAEPYKQAIEEHLEKEEDQPESEEPQGPVYGEDLDSPAGTDAGGGAAHGGGGAG
jgi:type I restriction enzyme M protein